MTIVISSEDIASRVIEQDLIGFNIHYDPRERTWSVWTRKRDSDGWNRSGYCENLEDALNDCIAPPERPDWMDLI